MAKGRTRGGDGGGGDGGWVKADLERRVPQLVIINLSGMQPLLLPDKLLHGFSGLAARQLHYPVHRSLHVTTACTHTVLNPCDFSYIAFCFICVIITALLCLCSVYFYNCHYLHGLFLKLYPFCTKQRDHIMSVRGCLSVKVLHHCVFMMICWFRIKL